MARGFLIGREKKLNIGPEGYSPDIADLENYRATGRVNAGGHRHMTRRELGHTPRGVICQVPNYAHSQLKASDR